LIRKYIDFSINVFASDLAFAGMPFLQASAAGIGAGLGCHKHNNKAGITCD
jgi:hypothetical protein